MIKIEFNVVGPTHAGRKVWDYFVLNQLVGGVTIEVVHWLNGPRRLLTPSGSQH